MAFVVVAGAMVQCSHGGQSKFPSGNPKLKIGGAAAVTAGMEAGVPFLPFGSPPTPDNPAPCPVQTTSTPPAPSPCTATLAATSGISTKILVGGLGVLLDSASGNTVNATSPGTWSIVNAGQALVKEA